MKFTVCCDEKPKCCENCFFYQDVLKKTSKANALECTQGCILGGENHQQCPLTEVNTIWNDAKDDGTETNKKLIQQYPFLLPRNMYTGKIPQGYDYSYTLLDDIPEGWRRAFGMQLCHDLKEALGDQLDKFRFTQIKEKYGRLCLYFAAATDSVRDVLLKYENLSMHTCIKCGATATKRSTGWISPWCDACAEHLVRESHEHVVPILKPHD